MILVNVAQVQDGSAVVLGVEDHHFKCSACAEVERRRVLTRHGREIDAAFPTGSATAPQHDHFVALLKEVLAKVRIS